MNIVRKKTREIKLGNLKIGNDNPISVQSMTKSKISDLSAIKNEIKNLTGCYCEVIRIAIPDEEAVVNLKRLIQQGIFTVPVVADVHFDYRLALQSIEAGAHGIRIKSAAEGPPETGHGSPVCFLSDKNARRKQRV